MGKLKINDLKKYLKEMSHDELIKEIVELSKQFSSVNEFYSAKLEPESAKQLFDKYKKTIKNEFFPDRGFGKMRYSNVNKAISDFKKISNDTVLVCELMLYYVEIGIEFTNTFGDFDEEEIIE